MFNSTFQVIIAQDYVLHLAILPSAAHTFYDGTQSEDLHPHLGGLEDPQVHTALAGHLSPLLMAHLSHLGPSDNQSSAEQNRTPQLTSSRLCKIPD